MFISILLVVISILLFSMVIFIHELGHFMTARWAGVKVNEFAIGMGPAIFKKQKGETLYSIRLLPIGGYCSMEGEDTESNDENAFGTKSAYKRLIIVAAGAIMNILLSVVFMVIILMQQTEFASTVIDSFSSDAVTNQYGLQNGDKILSMDGYNVSTYTDIGFVLAVNKDYSSNMVVERNGEKITLNGVKLATRENEDGKTVVMRDFYLQPIEKNFFTLIAQTFKEIVSNVRMTYATIVGLVTGTVSVNEVSGPVGMISMVSNAASEGLKENFMSALNNIIMMMMILSVNLGIFNLLPLPALDGGRVVFLILEAIIGKPVSRKYEGLIHTVGFVLLILFMLFITINDVFKLTSGRGIFNF